MSRRWDPEIFGQRPIEPEPWEVEEPREPSVWRRVNWWLVAGAAVACAALGYIGAR